VGVNFLFNAPSPYTLSLFPLPKTARYISLSSMKVIREFSQQDFRQSFYGSKNTLEYLFRK